MEVPNQCLELQNMYSGVFILIEYAVSWFFNVDFKLYCNSIFSAISSKKLVLRHTEKLIPDLDYLDLWFYWVLSLELKDFVYPVKRLFASFLPKWILLFLVQRNSSQLVCFQSVLIQFDGGG